MIRPAQPSDLDPVHRLLAARSRAAFGVAETELEQLRASWAVPGFVVGEDNWVAEDAGALVGYAALDSAHELVVAAEDPEVGDTLLRHAEERAQALGFPSLAVTVVPEDVPLYSLVERHDFALDRSIWRMWRSLDVAVPTPTWPDGVHVRSYDDADGEAVHALLDASYRGWDSEYVARAHADWLAWMTAHDEFDARLWFLAERDGELVGAALHWREHRDSGWVKDVVVREDERGRGLGKALLLHGLRAYAERGVARVGLKVDSTNPTGAAQLYARLGWVTDRTYEIRMRPL